MKVLRGALCCALVAGCLSAAPARAQWPWHRTPSASVLAARPKPYYGFENPPPYRWGWFGAQYHTRRIDQHGFYGYYFQYGYWQGYH